MDRNKAKQLESNLKGNNFHGLTIVKLINNGKSAAVFLATQPDKSKVALKIFDNDIIDRYGQEIQVQRIQQEISLKAHSIPGLIEILDGGKEIIGDTNYFFIVMSFVEGMNLYEYINSESYPESFVKKVAVTLFEVTEELLKKNIAHRDIKPENIMVTGSGEIILMDLGVLKLIGEPSASDVEQKQFLGTLLYAPPEFLTRKEEDTLDGWRAVNYYQIGAVMHDLIMKKIIFSHISPYPNIVIAIKEDPPHVSSSEYSFETIQITRDLLVKNSSDRLKLVPSARISCWASAPDKPVDDLSGQLEDLFQMGSARKAKLEEIAAIGRSTEEKRKIREDLAAEIGFFIRGALKRLQSIGGPDYVEHPSFSFRSDHANAPGKEVRNLLFSFNGTLADGYVQPIKLLVRFEVNEKSETEINLLGIAHIHETQSSNGNNPLDLFRTLDRQRPQNGGVLNRIYSEHEAVYFREPYYNFFSGIIGLDEQFETKFISSIIQIIKQGIQLMEKEVEYQLKSREKIARGDSYNKARVIDTTAKLIYDLSK
jgi:serine/threonine protein kinase